MFMYISEHFIAGVDLEKLCEVGQNLCLGTERVCLAEERDSLFLVLYFLISN